LNGLNFRFRNPSNTLINGSVATLEA